MMTETITHSHHPSSVRESSGGLRCFAPRGLLAAVVAIALQAGAAATTPRDAADSGNGVMSYPAAMKNLRFRELGPAIMGGRIDDLAVVESDPRVVYVGTASAGIWKTINAGTTWEPIFDNESVSSIGDVTLAPSDPSIVWVGTGEPNNRQSSSWGNGVYRSTDGGRSWKHLGLENTHHIGRIVVHPRNPDLAYVAAVGRLWGASEDRGVYKTTDGGKTWSKVLYINPDTGVVEIAMDPESPETLYAAAYQRRRTVFGFSGGGPHSGLYKTVDGGITWKKLTEGLPEGGETGRIGFSIYRKDPRILYALVEHAEGGTFRSDDRGETWKRTSDVNPRPMYYSKFAVDPNNDLRLWVMGASMYYSEDGGKTFVTNRVSRIHGDFHAIWINPADSNHMILGSDGGMHWSYDAGRTWDFVSNFAIGQFYEIGVDMRKPYWICGGLQDNGSWCGPSATVHTRGPTNDEWFRVGGGDGFYVRIDPTDHNIVYAESQDGNLFRRNMKTNESRSIRPEPAEGEARYRFQWNSPIVISAHDPKMIYYGGNFLFKSTDRGDSWTRLGHDLTTGAVRDKLPIMGRVPDRETRSRHDGVQAWPAITTVAESPRRAEILWVGTDDGNLQVTRDGGKTWKNVADRVPGVPKGTYVSRVISSHHADGTAYVTFDGHRNDDFSVYVFATTDYGETWKAISRGIPNNGGVVNVIREHHRTADLLFAGTEFGAFVSFDRGGSWHSLKLNMPTVPVDDIAIHPRENDLILATHGRSIWVMDDITPLEQLTQKVLASGLHAFDATPATAWRRYGHKASTGHKTFIADNPPDGAVISYFLGTGPQPKEKVRITVLDKAGTVVREMDGAGEPGVNRVTWDLRYGVPQLTADPPTGAAALRGPLVEPGEYAVRIAVSGGQVSGRVVVEEDSRIEITQADREARRVAMMRLFEMGREALPAQEQVTQLRRAVADFVEASKRPGARVPGDALKAVELFSAELDKVAASFVTVAPPQPLGSAGPPLVFTQPPLPQRIARLLTAIDGYTAAPTAGQVEQIDAIARELGVATTSLKKITEESLPALNRRINEAGVEHIRVGRR
jgi:photosystem II stability/assembly factor-like uncharacterized protein